MRDDRKLLSSKKCLRLEISHLSPIVQPYQGETTSTLALRMWYSCTLVAYTFGFVGAQTVYHSFGQELTNDSQLRVYLFSFKGIAAYVGLFTANLSGLFLASILESDYARQMDILSIGACILSLTTLVLVCFTKHGQTPVPEHDTIGFIPAFRSAVLRNHPYQCRIANGMPSPERYFI